MADDEAVFDDTGSEDDDSAIIPSEQTNTRAAEGILKVYSVGETTVVGFGGEDVPDETCIAGYRDQLMALTEEHDVKRIAFDLSGVTIVPSGMIGVLLSLVKLGLEIDLYNPSDDVREVLSITKLDKMFSLKEVDIDSL